MIIKKVIELVKLGYGIRFFRYCLSGGISAIVDLSIFYTLNEIFNFHYLSALVVSFTIAATVNYILQRKITFHNKYAKKYRQLAIFIILQAIGLLINGIITVILVEFLGVWPTLARFIAILLVLAYNYTTNKMITFKMMQ